MQTAGERRRAGAAQDAAAGFVLAAVTFAYALSFAALVFAGPVAAWAPVGVGGAMLSAALGCFAMAWLSSTQAAIGGPDTPVTAVVGALSAGIALSAPDAAPAQLFSTIVAACALAALAAAAALALIGWRRLGGWVRFVPYPVVAGFLAASGWFLCAGAARLSAPGLPGLSAAMDLRPGDWDWAGPAAAVATALAVLAARRISGSPMALPGVTCAAAAGLWAAEGGGFLPPGLLSAPTTGAGAGAAPAAGLSAAVPILLADPQAVDPALLLSAAPDILGVAGVAILAVLLNATGIEIEGRSEVDLDREYRASGLASLGAALVGGLASNLSLNRTLMARQAGGRGRLTSAAAGFGCLALALLGDEAAGFVPTPVLAGLLLYMGGGMLRRWLVDSAARLSTADYLLTLGIFALIVAFGYFGGAALGTAAACLTFVASYARAPFLRRALTRRDYGSFVERPAEDAALLAAEGDRILVFRLQGYLFFGAANQVLERVKSALAAVRGGPVAVALDFGEVTGFDSSAAFSILKLRRAVDAAGAALHVSGLSGPMADPERGLFAADGAPPPRSHETLEAALEQAEEHALTLLRGPAPARAASARDWLAAALRDGAAAEALLARLSPRPAAAGQTLCRQGEQADAVLFVVSGRVSIFLEREGAPNLRLRTMLGRTVIGEMAFYAGGRRTASVIAEAESEVYALTRDALAAMEREDPAAAALLHRFVVRTLSDRLAFANREVAALS